ncbi:hypothetical protein [Nonomuraea sp. NPDC049709]|uniref:hypothetical protein n=1 Tax=Nonomuraea sp. NPDC049709 TaxID=3154736 RepID=UPI003433095E
MNWAKRPAQPDPQIMHGEDGVERVHRTAELAVPTPADLAPTQGEQELRPVFPAWLADRHTAVATVRHKARRGGRIMASHLVRSPKYAWRLVPWALRGGWLGLQLLAEYVNANEYRDVVKDAKAAGDSDKVKAERQERRTQRTVRLRLVGVVLLAVAFVLRMAAYTWGAITLYITGAALFLVLVVMGRLSVEDKPPLLDQPQMPVQEDLAPEHLTAAFRAAGLLKDSAVLTLGFEGIWRDGNGWAATIDMPRGAGKTAADAIAKRDVLAAELGVDEIQLIMDRVRAHAGGHGRRLSIWLADDDPYLLQGEPKNNSPLIGLERFNLWEGPIPFGRDARGRRVDLDIKWQSVFFGGLMRRGKTFTQRLLTAAGVLDPYVDEYLADFKGGADWVPIRQVAVRYVTGVEDDALRAFDAMLDELLAEMNRRFALLRDLPTSVCPEGKLTPQIQKKYGLNWIRLTVDELQEALVAYDKDKREEVINKLARIARRGPAAGFIPDYASQRPDADSVPAKLRDIVSIRSCTQVGDRTSSDMVLGKGKAALGADASVLSEEHKGVNVLVTGPTNWVTVICDYLDGPAFLEICLRGRALRIEAGTLKGEAAGDVAALAEAAGQTIPPLLNDVLMVMRHSDRMHTHVLLSALENLDPEAYGDWDADRLAAELVTLGVERSGRQVKVDGVNLSGYRRADIEAAVPPLAWEQVPR